MELLLLAYLAHKPQETAARDELMALFWGEREEEKARNSLRQLVLRTRRNYGDILDVDASAVRLRSAALVTDVAEFNAATAAGRWEDALELWAGDFLAGCDYRGAEEFQRWLASERARLRRALITAFEQAVTAREASGDWRGMAHVAARWAEYFPLDETANRRAIEALHLAGRTAEGRTRQEAFEHRLKEELHCEPSSHWRRAMRRLADTAASVPAGDADANQLPNAWRAVTRGETRRVVFDGASAQHTVGEFVRWLTLTGQRHLHVRVTPQSTPRTALAPLLEAPGLAGVAPDDLAVLSGLLPELRQRFPGIPPAAVTDTGDRAGALARVLQGVGEEQSVLVTSDAAAPVALKELLHLAMEQRPRHVLWADIQASRAAAQPRSIRRRSLIAVAVAALLAALGAIAVTKSDAVGSAPRIVAVTRIDATGVPDSVAAVRILLSTNLARVQRLQVVSDARMIDVLAQLRLGGANDADLHRAARVAGASEVIEGVLSRNARGLLRLDLRRVDTESGRTLAGYAIEGSNVLELVDLATDRVARDVGGNKPEESLGTSTASLLAYRLYEEGLRAYYAEDRRGAQRFFVAALRQDSTFAMAAFFAALSTTHVDSLVLLLSRANELANREAERERLLIRTRWAAAMQDHARLAFAESLATRYAHEPVGHYEYGSALVASGRFLEAVPHLRRAIALDRFLPASATRLCQACEASVALFAAYMQADSAPAAERVAREAMRRDPGSYRAALLLMGALNAQGRHDAALRVLEDAAPLNPEPPTSPSIVSDILLRRADFATVDRMWLEHLRGASPNERFEALNGQLTSFRLQGRLREAERVLEQLRSLGGLHDTSVSSRATRLALTGILALERGTYRRAAAAFDSAAALRVAEHAARNARHRAWLLSHAATAYAASGDTARLRVLEDTVRLEGSRSAYARDQRLHHYVRGLRLRLSGRREEAAAALRASLYSPVEGNPRASMELARTLLTLGRNGEAMSVARSALRGPIGASGLYANRTELLELYASACEAAGERQCAVEAYEQVLAAWERAEPEFTARREGVRARLAVLRASR